MATKVMAAAADALVLLGSERDPECWVAWGDDPGARYAILALTPAGLAVVNVRVNMPGEGPRAAGKIVRWHRVSVGELSVEIHGGHRLISFQLESQILHASDEEADEVARFVGAVFAAIDGRPAPTDDAIALPGPAAGESSEPAAR
ncbi:MAG: hypothetical protein HY262_09445 [Chloroflexi bacterium]|nr:hypothetical protein [Chloroflexota bacterium]